MFENRSSPRTIDRLNAALASENLFESKNIPNYTFFSVKFSPSFGSISLPTKYCQKCQKPPEYVLPK